MQRAINENREVYDFLHSTRRVRHRGSGARRRHIHQVCRELAFRAGYDRRRLHTPNAAASAWPPSVGGADCGEAMASGLGSLDPKLIGVHSPSSRAELPQERHAPISAAADRQGGTNRSSSTSTRAQSISAGKGTICNWARTGGHHLALPLRRRMAALPARHRSRRHARVPSSTAALVATGRDPYPGSSMTRWSRSISGARAAHVGHTRRPGPADLEAGRRVKRRRPAASARR